jgi:hypothetical protein
MAIATWPAPHSESPSMPLDWRWTVDVYMFPTSPAGGVVRGKVVVLTTRLPGPDSFSSGKVWQLSEPPLAYADVPSGGQVNFLISSDRDPRRPFITKPSDRYGQISDADLLAVVGLLRGGAHAGWAISEVAVMDPNLVTVETIDSNPAHDAGESVIVQRTTGQWAVMNTVAHQVPGPAPFRTAWGTAPRSSTLLVGIISILAAGLNVFGLWVLFSAWKSGRGSPQFILGLLPVSLMFLIAPVPAMVLQIIRDFASLAPSGGNAAAMFANTGRGFLFGASGFVLSLASAAALQWHAGWVDESVTGEPVPSRHSSGWQTTVLALSPAIAVPVLLFCMFVERLPRTFMEQAMTIMHPTGASPGPDPAHVSRMISSWLVLGLVGGIIGAGIVALVGVTTLIIVRSARFPPRVTTYAWIVLALAATLGVWNVSRVVMDLNWLATTATRPPL